MTLPLPSAGSARLVARTAGRAGRQHRVHAAEVHHSLQDAQGRAAGLDAAAADGFRHSLPARHGVASPVADTESVTCAMQLAPMQTLPCTSGHVGTTACQHPVMIPRLSSTRSCMVTRTSNLCLLTNTLWSRLRPALAKPWQIHGGHGRGGCSDHPAEPRSILPVCAPEIPEQQPLEHLLICS